MEIRQSMGRVGSCVDNAAADAFFSSLEWEVLSRHDFKTLDQAQAVVLDWCYGVIGSAPFNRWIAEADTEPPGNPHFRAVT